MSFLVQGKKENNQANLMVEKSIFPWANFRRRFKKVCIPTNKKLKGTMP